MDVLQLLWILPVAVICGSGQELNTCSGNLLAWESEDASNVCNVTDDVINSWIKIARDVIKIETTVGSSDYNCTTRQCNHRIACNDVSINVTICRAKNIIATSSVSGATHTFFSTPKQCDCDKTSSTTSKPVVTRCGDTSEKTEDVPSSSLKRNTQTSNTGFEDTNSRATVVTVGVCSFIGGVISVIVVAVAYDRLRPKTCKVRCRKQTRTASQEDSRSFQDSQVVEFHEYNNIRQYSTLDKMEQRGKRLERKKKRKRNKETSAGKSRGMQPCTFIEPSQRNSAKIYELSVALHSGDHIYEGVHSRANLDELEQAWNRKSDISENADHPYRILEKIKRAESDLETDESSAMHECIDKGTAEVMLSQENDRDSKYSLSSNHDYWILEKVKRAVSNGEREETLEPTVGGAEKAVAELKNGDSECTNDEDRPNWTLAGEQEVENEENKDRLYTQTEPPTEVFAEDHLKLSLQKEAENKTDATY